MSWHELPPQQRSDMATAFINGVACGIAAVLLVVFLAVISMVPVPPQ